MNYREKYYSDDNYDTDLYVDDYNSNDSYDDINPLYSNSYELNDYNNYNEVKSHKSLNDIFNDDEDEEAMTSTANDNADNDLLQSVDDDLAGYFSDARLFAPKKKMVDTMKKKPKRIIHKAGAKVNATVNKQAVTGIILFGPYESNKKQMYQLELDSGEIIEAEEKKIIAI